MGACESYKELKEDNCEHPVQQFNSRVNEVGVKYVMRYQDRIAWAMGIALVSTSVVSLGRAPMEHTLGVMRPKAESGIRESELRWAGYGWGLG